uniref:DinB-like domain-containing protein n=1 Tax=uncultured Armatimonadetes bacterium TaxID=157466 RepID=A0A6J4IL99_9BACT|nr:hypothetical protein AVDCRST_MAG63-2035 [uncultured Armatimonadetes bacterium]
MDVRRQLAYADKARLLLRETLEANPEAFERRFETTGPYHTIRELVAHLVGAEQRWTIGRLYGEPRPPRYEDAAAQTLAGLFTDWEDIRARTRAFASRADADTLARVIRFEMPPGGQTVSLTLEEVLFNICNHQSWHLGQISMALQQMGTDPPNFDYVLLRPAP